MPRREPTPAKDFAFDFTADWTAYAVLVPGSEAARLGCTLHGTVTKDGKTYGLAHHDGRYACCDLRGNIRNLTALEHSAISLAVEFKRVPGLQNAPKKPTDLPIGLTGRAVKPAAGNYERPTIYPDGACEACGRFYNHWTYVGTICQGCRTGLVLPAHCWNFIQWPDGGITATPDETLTEEDVAKIRARCRRKS